MSDATYFSDGMVILTGSALVAGSVLSAGLRRLRVALVRHSQPVKVYDWAMDPTYRRAVTVRRVSR